MDTWAIVQLVMNILIGSIWTSILLLIFTISSSPYNSRQSVNVLKEPNKSPRKDSLGMMSYDDSNVANAENHENDNEFNNNSANKDDTKSNIDNNSKNDSNDNNDNNENNNNHSEEDNKQQQNNSNERKKDNAKKKLIENFNNDANYKLNSKIKKKYKKRKLIRSIFRAMLTWICIIPIFLISSFVCNFFQLMARLSIPFFNFKTRMYLSSWFAARWFPILLFLTEYWPNIKYRIHNMNPELFQFARKTNMIVTPNHAESPFDWVAAVTFSDVMGRVSRSYGIMKRLFLLIPTIGWTGALSGSLALNRNWEADKKRLKNMFGYMANDYAQPWFLLLYPEGTRQTPKKLKEAQDWAKKQGFPPLNNLLQPRVKGFTFFSQELAHKTKTVEYIVDVTNLYIPKPPPGKRFALTGRLHDRLDMVLRIYKTEDMPREQAALDQWLRDRWTEKDQLIDDMRDGKIEYDILERDPLGAVLHYAFYCIFSAYMCNALFHIWSLYCTLWLLSALFPILMIYIERSNGNLHEFLLSADFSMKNLVNASINGLNNNMARNYSKLQEQGSKMKYNWQYPQGSPKVKKLADKEFVGIGQRFEGDDNDGMDVKSGDELYEPQTIPNENNNSSSSMRHRNRNIQNNGNGSVTTSGYRNDR